MMRFRRGAPRPPSSRPSPCGSVIPPRSAIASMSFRPMASASMSSAAVWSTALRSLSTNSKPTRSSTSPFSRFAPSICRQPHPPTSGFASVATGRAGPLRRRFSRGRTGSRSNSPSMTSMPCTRRRSSIRPSSHRRSARPSPIPRSGSRSRATVAGRRCSSAPPSRLLVRSRPSRLPAKTARPSPPPTTTPRSKTGLPSSRSPFPIFSSPPCATPRRICGTNIS